jgi:hypothetical protein
MFRLLMLRTGMAAALNAWRFGDDPRQKPLYTLNSSGEDGNTKDNALFVVSRGLEDVEWLRYFPTRQKADWCGKRC